jgi:hypothetical protein
MGHQQAFELAKCMRTEAVAREGPTEVTQEMNYIGNPSSHSLPTIGMVAIIESGREHMQLT